MPAVVVKLGPGQLSIGATGTETDFTCQVTAARVEWAVDEGDTVQVLCGEAVPGARTYSASLTGSILADIGDASSIQEYSWTHKGEQTEFVFVPSTLAAKQISGTLTVDPISIGGDEAGANMASDFEWPIVGDPIIGPAVVAEAAATSGSRRREAA